MSLCLPMGLSQADLDTAIQDEPEYDPQEMRDQITRSVILDLQRQLAERDREIAELRDKYEPGWRVCPF